MRYLSCNKYDALSQAARLHWDRILILGLGSQCASQYWDKIWFTLLVFPMLFAYCPNVVYEIYNMVSRKFIKYPYIILFDMFNIDFELLCYLNNNNDFLVPILAQQWVKDVYVSVAKLTLSSHGCPNVFSE